MNRDLREVLVELDDLVAQSSTALSLQRLRDTFDSARRFSEWVVPAQTVCNYWNYWFTFLPEALSDRDQVGYSFRQALTNAPLGPHRVHVGPATITRPGRDAWARRRLLGHPGHGSARAPAEPGRRRRVRARGAADRPRPPLRPDRPEGCATARAARPATSWASCRFPGQPESNPSVGVADIPGTARPIDSLLRRERDPAGRLGASRVP